MATARIRARLPVSYDACSRGILDPDCQKVIASWRRELIKNPELISEIAELYADRFARSEELRNVLKAQVELLLASWLARSADLDNDTADTLDALIERAYDVLHQHGILLEAPLSNDTLEYIIFATESSILQALDASNTPT